MADANLSNTLKEISDVIKGYETDIQLGKDLEILKKNKHFINVIMNGYIEVEAKKLFDILLDPSGVSPYSDEEIHRKLDAISNLKGYIGTDKIVGSIEVAAKRAPLAIAKEEEYRLEITAEAAMENNYE